MIGSTSSTEATFVVNGQPTRMCIASSYEPLRSVCSRAMSQTGHLQYGPLDKWEARSVKGALLDMDLSWHWITSALDVTPQAPESTRVYLNLKPGVAA